MNFIREVTWLSNTLKQILQDPYHILREFESGTRPPENLNTQQPNNQSFISCGTPHLQQAGPIAKTTVSSVPTEKALVFLETLWQTNSISDRSF
jgi:hypothetical protein